MKKGFTLVELIATLIVLAIIGMITFPVVNNSIKNGQEKLYKAQIKEIEEACEKWAYSNIDLLPSNGDSITVTLLELKKAGLLPLDIRDPRDKQLLPNDMQVVIKSDNNIYSFVVNEESGTEITSEVNKNSPILVLNGNPIEYVEFGSVYEDKGAKAKNKFGDEINNINVVYQYNGTEIGVLSTSEFKTYTVVYSVSSVINEKTYTSSITRTVVVRDTTAPVITLPGTVDIALSNVSSFNLLEGVIASDNSGENIEINVSELNKNIGKQTVSYTACDSHQNCITKKRIINITE